MKEERRGMIDSAELRIAIDYFKRRKGHLLIDDIVQQRENVAIEALEKRVPVKVTRVTTPKGKIERCPVCKSLQDWAYPYCKYCGQALDWNKEEQDGQESQKMDKDQ